VFPMFFCSTYKVLGHPLRFFIYFEFIFLFFFGDIWIWTQGLMISAMPLVFPLCSSYFSNWVSHFCLVPASDYNPTPYSLPLWLKSKSCATLTCLLNFVYCLPGLFSDCDLPDIHFLNSWDYGHKSPCLALNWFLCRMRNRDVV
jgi:hypothetical protein